MTTAAAPGRPSRGASAREALARFGYSTLLRLATPLFLLRLVWRGRREPLYREHLGERLGFGDRVPHDGRLWLHAVSLGETRAAAALLAELRRQRSGLRVLLTHGTATGRAAGIELLQEGDAQAWLPYDTPGAVRRFLARQRPAMGVVMETEVWPNLLHEAAAIGLPLVLANARLSEKSAAQGRRLAALLHPAVARFDAVLAQSEADAARLRAAGAHDVRIAGNLKFDMTPDAGQLAAGRAWRDAIGRPVVLAASTREGEEGPLLDAWRAAATAAATATATATGDSAARSRALLLLVPRHPQRFDEVAQMASSRGFVLRRRSEANALPAPDADTDVLLGDSLGEMALYGAAAQVALLGGSFAPLGGQNLIEIAASGCPIVMGPHTFNFAQAAERAESAGAAERVADIEAGVERAIRIACGDEQVPRAAAARAFAAADRGAAERMAREILALLDTRPATGRA